MNCKKELRLPELQARKMKCVFCDASNQKVEGGYFKEKFVCRKCEQAWKDLDLYLEM